MPLFLSVELEAERFDLLSELLDHIRVGRWYDLEIRQLRNDDILRIRDASLDSTQYESFDPVLGSELVLITEGSDLRVNIVADMDDFTGHYLLLDAVQDPRDHCSQQRIF